MKTRKFFTKLVGSTSTLLMFAFLTAACTRVEAPIPIPDPKPATYTIKGDVYNNATNAALAGVTVKMGTLSTTTNTAGRFEFLNLATSGKYTINLTKDGFLPTSISIEFPTAAPDHALIFTLSAKMVPYLPDGKYIEPSVGGTLFIEGGAQDATLTVAPNTTAKDETGATITTSYQILATLGTDQATGATNLPPLKVLNFLPNGYTFSPALTLKLENPLTSYRYSNVVLQYFKNNAWETQTTPVTFDVLTNDYVTKISHFSSYKLGLNVPVGAGSTTSESIVVYDSLKINRGLTTATWSNWKFSKKGGYVFSEPLETTLSNLGIVGADQTQLINSVKDIVKGFNDNVSALQSFTLSDDVIVDERTIPSLTYLTVAGKQNFTRKTYTITITDLNGSNEKSIVFTTIHAGTVELIFTPKEYDEHAHAHYHGHDHGLGGGGTI